MSRVQNTVTGLNLCVNSCFQVAIDVVNVDSLCTAKGNFFTTHIGCCRGIDLICSVDALQYQMLVWGD